MFSGWAQSLQSLKARRDAGARIRAAPRRRAPALRAFPPRAACEPRRRRGAAAARRAACAAA
jgi:hypothetical protein